MSPTNMKASDTPQPGSVIRREIAEQPNVLARVLTEAAPIVDQIATRSQSCELAVLAARGSSDNASTYGQYLIESLAGLPVALATPSLFTLYGTPPRLNHALVVGVSQSGQGVDVSEVVAEARRQGAVTAGITNTAGSLLARSAEHVVLLGAGEEKALAATKTVTAQCLVYALLAARMASPDRLRRFGGLQPGLDALPADVAATLALEPHIVERAKAWLDVQSVAVIGRGFAYGAAQEIALKLKETSFISAMPYSAADFMHGPLAMVEPGFAVLLLLAHDQTLDTNLALVDSLRSRGADVLILATPEAALRLPPDVKVVVVSATHTLLSPISHLVAGQLFATHLSLLRGYNPDVSRGVTKVTVTV